MLADALTALRATAVRLRERAAYFRSPASGRRRRIGWVSWPWRAGRRLRTWQLDSFNRIRADTLRRWTQRLAPQITSELYDPSQRYDVVVFVKMMDPDCQAEARRIQRYGGRVVFDANVNYYERWGDYVIPGTEPTAEQQRDAREMTALADWVVADSNVLLNVVRAINECSSWIADPVDLEVYRGMKEHRRSGRRLIWSGIAKKAEHLQLLSDVWPSLGDVELVLVAEQRPGIMSRLPSSVRSRFVPYRDGTYPGLLLDADVVISPKMLVNGYEVAHTEYKIALGMAQGLPAVASPQRSYLDLIAANGGGRIVSGPDEWRHALSELLTDDRLRRRLGAEARQAVVEHYSAPVIAAKYLAVLERTMG